MGRLIPAVVLAGACVTAAARAQTPADTSRRARPDTGMSMPTPMPARDTGRRAAAMPMTAHDTGMRAMPIPMPPGMIMLPGLVGLRPDITPFLPGAGVNPATLPAARAMAPVRLADGDTLDLTATLVRRTVHGHTFTAYGFNGEVPGPLIRVPQGATIIVRYHNAIDLPSTVHWHGVRLDNRFDGVPGVTQEPVEPGQGMIYRVHFPDAGIYWYHPHVREDIEQPMGLFGGIRVDAADSGYYPPANEEHVLILDDLLMNADTLIPFGKDGPDFALTGRVGNVLLVNGEPGYRLTVRPGAVVRFFLINTASARTYNLSFGGAPIKVVASDLSRFEHEELVPSVVIAPAERYVVDVRFLAAGRYALVNAVQTINHVRGIFQAEVDTLGVITVAGAPAEPDEGAAFAALRTNAAVVRDIDRYRPYFDRPADKRITLTLRTSGLALASVQFMTVDTQYYAPVEWIDGMPDMNWLATSRQVQWVLRDDATGKEDMAIDWHVRQGSVVKLELYNDPRSFHPMQHPIHLHGQRMLVVARDGVPNPDLVWKETVLVPVGQTVDVLIDASNPGAWMMHCHVAEHLGAGMMTVLHVDPVPGAGPPH